MKALIGKKLHDCIFSLYHLEKEINLTTPPSEAFGDFSTNIAFGLSKEVGQTSREVANLLQQELAQDTVFLKVEVAGPGFLNLFVNKKLFAYSLVTEILTAQDAYLATHRGDSKKVSIEHTAANPNKHLHIGHLRNFSIADTLVRVFAKTGHTVSVQYFNNDQGLQVAKVVWGFRHLDVLGEKGESLDTEKFDTIAARIYVAAEKYLAIHPEYEEEIRSIIRSMEAGDNEVARESDTITRKILQGQITTVAQFGVYYDELITESSMTQSGEVERVMRILIEKGKAVKETEGENAGCIVLKNASDIYGNPLPDKVLIRADGTAVYTGKDIVLHLWKFGLLNVAFPFVPLVTQSNGHIAYISVGKNTKGEMRKESADLHINVVDQRQSYPLQVVKESLKALEYTKESEHLFHLAYETVTLSIETAHVLGVDTGQEKKKWVAMSGRKGIEVSIDALLAKVTEYILEKNKGKSPALTHTEAQQIAAGALRYYMIKYGYTSIIVFDLEAALQSDGDTGIYLMYAYVRAQKILEKMGIYNKTDVQVPETLPESVTNLLFHMSFAQEIVNAVVADFQVHKLALFTYELAKLFTSFYQQVSIIHEQDSLHKEFYHALVTAFVLLYGQLLSLLGIATPDKM